MSSNSKKLSKPADLFSLVLAGFTILIALVFFRERLYADAAYYFFHAINAQSFHIEHGRLVLAISQLVPLGGLYLGLELKQLAILASLGNALFYVLLALFIRFRYSNSYLALGALLIPVVNQHFLHFSPMMEITYGGALLMLYYVLLTNGESGFQRIVLLTICVILILTSHPEHFISVAVLTPSIRKTDKNWLPVAAWIVFIIIVIFVIKISTFSEYEAGKVSAYTDHNHHISQLWHPQYIKELLLMLLSEYTFAILTFMFCTAYFLKQKDYFRTLQIFAGVVALIVLVNSAKEATNYTRYIQSMYSPFVAIVLVFLLAEVIPRLHQIQKSILILAIAAFTLYEAHRIWGFGEDLSRRTAMHEAIIEKARNVDGQKFFIDKDDWQPEYYWFGWSTPMELLILSSFAGPNETMSILEREDLEYNQNFERLDDGTFVVRRFEIEKNDFLNSRFFSLPKGPYRHLSAE
ncbi:MAG: hypothetical protein EA392_09130 [Cryomorphaceae bacterium]|nr:MAG: hypothetical protein EA392_09130 [Cryomorphaceae bacterium]